MTKKVKIKENKSYKPNEENPVIVDVESGMKKPVKGLPKAR
ncbi:hypothetical protein Q428_07380 [Fervidicella metallireducens AeB]|uniref:Uncharacterized protein n=1 Tax=Fervidicella metallireducens AeB TaxID=1403537 RepID=A0A017RW32_9CLOT|nr:hypothetical protein [Fervidicella metallireducens]EYE88584.1 hypothetical protein Q428_07380 [Fervidicella metallireducens AeB]